MGDRVVGLYWKKCQASWRCHVHVSNFVMASNIYFLFASKRTILCFYYVLVLFLPCLDDHFWVDDRISFMNSSTNVG